MCLYLLHDSADNVKYFVQSRRMLTWEQTTKTVLCESNSRQLNIEVFFVSS